MLQAGCSCPQRRWTLFGRLEGGDWGERCLGGTFACEVRVCPCVRAYVAVDAEKWDALLSLTADACGCKQSERSKLRGSFERGGRASTCVYQLATSDFCFIITHTDIDIPGKGEAGP